MTYKEKLLDPRWQKKRLEILGRDNFTCRRCGDKKSTLHVHHNYYEGGADPWDYPPESLVTLCEDCHSQEKDDREDAEGGLLFAMREGGWTIGDLDTLSAGIEESRGFGPFPPSEYVRLFTEIMQNKDALIVLGAALEKLNNERLAMICGAPNG